MTELQPFVFDGEQFPVVQMPSGDPGLPLHRLTTPIGLDPNGQKQRIERSPWSQGRACVMHVQLPGDDRVREHFVISYRIIPTWIVTIDSSRIKDDAARDRIVRWQCELADALADYVFNGGALNPRATADQLEVLAARTRAQLEAVGVAKRYGLVNSSYLEGMSRTLLARMTGEEPQIDPADMTITCQEYVEDKGLTGKTMRSARTRLGTAVAALYRARYGQDPQKIKRPIDGVYRPVGVYTHRDLDLFHTAWAEVGRHYPGAVRSP
ncbi:phage antirepressor N-terminal domain-containing protein [Actinomadura macra]|uniref:phage antirepressor N-terminal domain-containing protein n=1 Tax=Actinomadura macra TaxID=46164 RepID=UPI000834C082|nr:phage antirepressor N-terminal domain-containing protein [Actinomadura macra]